jgi:tRNA G26 N,N-dimethylase Trm1
MNNMKEPSLQKECLNLEMFNSDVIASDNKQKTYRALRHNVVRKKQKENSDDTHHPDEKIDQIRSVFYGLNNQSNHHILELFAGQGNLTKIYEEYGIVSAYDRKYLKTGDSFLIFHDLIAKKKKYSIVDLDPYGFPNRFFPDIFLLIDDGILFVTMPKPYVNILNGITQAHLISYYGEHNPSEDTIIEQIALWGLCHWRQVELIDSVDCKSVWRFAFHVKKVKATEYTGVRNR